MSSLPCWGTELDDIKEVEWFALEPPREIDAEGWKKSIMSLIS
jgi:hypothetical protein